MQKVLKETPLKEIELIKDVGARVYIDSKGRVYKINYYLNRSMKETKNKVELVASFFRFNTIKELNIK